MPTLPPPVPPPPPAIVEWTSDLPLKVQSKTPKVAIDQIGADINQGAETKVPTRVDRQVDLTQIPQNRRPLKESDTTGTGDPAVEARPPAPSLPDELIRAWYAIQSRGVVPNADLMIAELGPDTITRLFGTSGLPPSVLTTLDSLMQSTAQGGASPPR